jgi:hypothetical protein
MNKTKQFWSLFKFQTTVNPFIWFMPFAFGMPFFLPLLMVPSSATYHLSLSSIFMSNQNLFFVGIFGAMVLAPEKFQMAAANLVSTYYGSEFILTRAIDRHVLYRAKAAVLYLLVLTLPCVALANSLRNPDLIVNEYSKVVQQQCLAAVPASTLIPASKKNSQPLILIARGNVLVAEWQLWVMLIAAITLQLFILILYPFKYGKIIFWVLYFGLILVPLFDLTHLGKDEATDNEQLFFSFAAHQVCSWILIALAFVLTQLWCERRYAQLEQ